MPTHSPSCAMLNRSMWANCDCNVSLYAEMDKPMTFTREPSWHGISGTDTPEQTEAFRFCDERDIAVFDLTVITPRGEFTAENVREDSIKFVDGTLTCEDTANDAKLFTFFDVIGYYNG